MIFRVFSKLNGFMIVTTLQQKKNKNNKEPKGPQVTTITHLLFPRLVSILKQTQQISIWKGGLYGQVLESCIITKQITSKLKSFD